MCKLYILYILYKMIISFLFARYLFFLATIALACRHMAVCVHIWDLSLLPDHAAGSDIRYTSGFVDAIKRQERKIIDGQFSVRHGCFYKHTSSGDLAIEFSCQFQDAFCRPAAFHEVIYEKQMRTAPQ